MICMPTIYFFGPDGSGKSTLAKAIVRKLRMQGFEAKLSWMRGTHTFASLLARLLPNFKAFKGLDNPYYGITIPRKLKSTWQFIEFVSILPILFARLLIPSRLGYIVVAERSIPDFLVWVSITTKDANYLESFNSRFLIALTMRAKVRIYVTAEPSELLKRRADTSPLFIQEQLILYEKIARDTNAFKLDTTKLSMNESLKDVLNLLNIR